MRLTTVLIAIVAFVLLLGAAGSRLARADDSSNNGTIKIHEGSTEREPIEANDPHVCAFHIHGFNFDASSSGSWRIDEWPPTGTRTEVVTGNWTSDATGEWRTALLALPDGHYKAFAKQMDSTTVGGDKQKVFWVACGATAPAGSGPSGSTGASGSSGPNGASGSSGPNGASGATGTGGSAGTTGVNGPSGPTGEAGTQAVTGATGVTAPVDTSGSKLPDGTNSTAAPLASPGVQGFTNLPQTSTETPTTLLVTVGAILVVLGTIVLILARPKRFADVATA